MNITLPKPIDIRTVDTDAHVSIAIVENNEPLILETTLTLNDNENASSCETNSHMLKSLPDYQKLLKENHLKSIVFINSKAMPSGTGEFINLMQTCEEMRMGVDVKQVSSLFKQFNIYNSNNLKVKLFAHMRFPQHPYKTDTIISLSTQVYREELYESKCSYILNIGHYLKYIKQYKLDLLLYVDQNISPDGDEARDAIENYNSLYNYVNGKLYERAEHLKTHDCFADT